MSIAVILSWYLGGAWAAAWMVRRGHSATPWCIGGALLGALLWIFALPCARIAGRDVHWITQDPKIRPVGRLVVGLFDEAGSVAVAAASVSGPDDHLVIVHRLGREATSSVIETGELDEADRRIATARRLWRGTVEAKIGSGPPEKVVTAALDRRRPDLVVHGPVTGWAWRTAMRRSLALGAELRCPVLHTAATAPDAAPVAPTQLTSRTSRMARNGRHA